MDEQIPLDESALAAEAHKDNTREVARDVAYKRLAIVNVVFFGPANAGPDNWVLIDAGVAGTAGIIRRAAEERFGENARPAAIIMTHGHFDHAGALETLAEEWDVPIYAHALELPYLNGTASYPPPDPSVGGGMMAWMSKLYPRGPYNVSRWLQPLPADGSVPHMPGWRWIHVPGHTVGQIALWREGDRVLLPADAFITTRQESAYAVAVQKPELHGPP
ncbi:MAG TPA: MBL fold metallo-hydrolase, partial [Chthoniobacterales bacterium]